MSSHISLHLEGPMFTDFYRRTCLYLYSGLIESSYLLISFLDLYLIMSFAEIFFLSVP